MRAIKETVVIMSAARSDKSFAVNLVHNNLLRAQLQTFKDCGFIRFSAALGFYKGEAEHSFVIVIERRHEDVLNSLLILAKDHEQECVLVRDDSGVRLVYMQYFPQPYKAPERIGRDLFRVEFHGDERPDSYTYFKGQTWVVA